MNNTYKQTGSQVFLASILIVAAAFTRLLPHAPNFTAIGAIAIFGGRMIKDRKLAFLIPLAALLLSDACLQLSSTTKGFYGTSQYFVYGAFIIITALSTFIKRISSINIILACVWSAIIFFLITNFGTWVAQDIPYPQTFSGLMACYWAALPFYKNELFGNFLLNSVMADLFYSALLFGIYYLASVARKENAIVAQ